MRNSTITSSKLHCSDISIYTQINSLNSNGISDRYDCSSASFSLAESNNFVAICVISLRTNLPLFVFGNELTK